MVSDVFDPGALVAEFGARADIPPTLKRIVDSCFDGAEKQGASNAPAFRDDDVFTVVFPTVKNNQDLTIIYDKIWAEFPSARAFRDSADRRGIQIACKDLPGLG